MNPPEFTNEVQLEEYLTRPSPVLIDHIRSVASPLVLLGAGGKMGPTLAILAQRASHAARHPLKVIAVSRFSDESVRYKLEAKGIHTIGADLLVREALESIPDATEIIYLAGVKFGTRNNPALTWASNTLAPAHAVERFSKSRIVALSTGNVYGLANIDSGGSLEGDLPSPVGEYANAALARERIFEYTARKHSTAISLIRLNYAVELRYGVLADLASQILSGKAIDLTSGYFNCIWQGDANEMILRALALTSHPPSVFNLSSPTLISIRETALRMGELLGKKVKFSGTESETALISNTTLLTSKLGPPPTPIETAIQWTAKWVQNGGRSLNKPTHFEVRDGDF